MGGLTLGIKDFIQKRRLVKANKQLIEEFPFLLPRNRWTGKVSEDYDYTYTELDALPDGWRKAFGIQMCQEIKDSLIKSNYLDEYRIMQIKEKYGTLRWYDGGHPKEVGDIISKYEYLSMCYCHACGKNVKYVTRGWINYCCEDCKNEMVESGYNTEEDFIRLTEEDIPHRHIYKKNEDGTLKEEEVEIDIDFKKIWELE